ncbi:MAG: NAD(P)-dependent oxidoreductase, partial [Bdellovibrionota bacterium]
ITIREMIENVRRMVGRGQPQFGQLAYRPGENMALYADISRAKALLGWTPEVDISEGLKRTLSWMESQK